MSEIEEDRAYYEAAEAAFIRRRGTPFLLSPSDFVLLKQWRALGIPIEVVEAGIDHSFSRREERGAVGRINSLSYCRDAVLEAWERRAETARGRRSAGPMLTSDVASVLATLAERLRQRRASHPELSAPLESAERALARLRASGKPAEEVEVSLARLDRRLAKELYESLPEALRSELDRDVSAQLAAARARMDPAALEKTIRALTRRGVRERLDLPRLSLL